MDPNNLPKFVYLHKNHKYRLKLGFYAAPSNPKIFSKAIRDELHKLKFTYCSDLNGLVMGFGKISSNELIAADIRHCISVAVNVDVFIFRPPVGSTIEAVVNQTSDNHISCLVHSLFNVSIVRPEHQPSNNWSGSKIKKNDKINVKVLSFDLTKKLPHITGEIIENNKDECNNFNDEQDNFPMKSSPSIKSLNNNSTKNVMKSKEKEEPDSSSNDSESSNEMEQIAFSKTNEVFTKTSPLFQGKYNNSKDKQNNSSIKSVNYNNYKNVMKPKEKEDPDYLSNDSESSNEIKHTTLSNTHDVITKIQPSFKDINSKNVMKIIEKKNSDSTSSDSESSNTMKQTTFSKTLDVFTKTSPLLQGKYKDAQDNSPVKSISPIKSVNYNNDKNIITQIEEDSDSSSNDFQSSNEMKHTTSSNTHEVITKIPPSFKGNNAKNVTKPIEKKDTDGTSSDSESSNTMKQTIFSKTLDVFTKTSPLLQGKYKDAQDNSPVKSVNYNNNKNIITQIEEDSDSSSNDFQSSNEMKHTTSSNTHEVITKIPPSFKGNNAKNVTKPIEKKDTDGTSSDSESSNTMKQTIFSKTLDVFTKTSPLLQGKYKDAQDNSPVKSVNYNNNKNIITQIEEDSDSSSNDFQSSNEMKHTTSSNTHEVITMIPPSFKGNNTKNVTKPIEKRDTDSTSSDSESSNTMKQTTFSKTLDVFTKTSPLLQGKYKNARDNSPVKSISPIKSVNYNNDKNIITQIEEDSDSSSNVFQSSNEMKHTTSSNTHEVITKIPPSFKDNNTKNVTKPIEKKDTDSTSSDSESSNEMKHTTSSNTHEVITKIPPSFKDNNTKNVTKPIEKKDTDSTSSDSESSNKMKHTTFSKTQNVFNKISPLFQDKFKDSKNEQDISPIKSVNDNNTKNVMKLVEKEDTDSSSSDCESSKKIKHITFSKTSSFFQGKYKDSKDKQEIKYLSSIKSISDKNTKNYLKQKEKDDPDSSSSNSESSDETKPIHTFNNKNNINGPLFSSTPNSEHTVNNIGLGRNKLQEQLRKHLAKNRTTKQKSCDFIKSSSNLVKNFNIENDLKIDDYEFNIPDTTVDNNKNIDDVDKIKLQNNMQSDSGISGDELRQKKFSIDNSSKSPSIKSKKTIKKSKNSDKTVSAILHSFSSDEKSVTKSNLSIDCNADHCKIEEVKNTMYTQQNHDSMNLDNADRDILNHFKSPHGPIVKFLPELRLSTKYISHKKKDIIEENKKKMENELLQNQSNINPSMISDSECSNSDIEDDVRSIIDVNHETYINKQIQNNKYDIPNSTIGISEYASSSDDEIYSKLRQSVSKIEDNTKSCEQIKNYPSYDTSSSDDESVSSFKLHNTSVLSLKSLQSNTTKINSLNKFETDNCNIISDKRLDKNPLKIQNKIQHVNQMSTILQSPTFSNDKSKLSSNLSCENNSKIDLIKQILEEDSTSDDEIGGKTLQSNITNKCEILNKKPTNQIPASSVLKLNENTNTALNKDIVNPFINFYMKNTSSGSEDDSSIFKSTKSTKKSCSSVKKTTPSVGGKKSHKDVLINKFLSSMKHEEKKPKMKLLTEQINYNPSENNKPVKIKEPKRDELQVKTKNKSKVLKKLIIPVIESKSNELNLNNSLNKNMLLSEIPVSSNDSTDDEVDLIKKIIKSRELNKTTDESDSIFTNNILTKPNNPNLTAEKLNKKFKSVKASTHLINKLTSDDTKLKKKRPEESKDILLNSILNSISSNGHPPNKKNDSSIIRSTEFKILNEFKDNCYEKSISKSKKQNSDNGLSKSKKKKKDLDLVIDINDELKDKVSDQDLSKFKKKKKNHNLVINTNYELKDKVSDQGLPKSKKKKKDHSLVVGANNEFIDKIFDHSLSKSKKKKNDKKRPNESNNILLNSILNSLGSSSDGHPPTKKKKKNDNLVIKPTDEFKDNYYEKNISKSKEKKKDLDLVIDINDELKDKISNQGLTKSKKKKKDHNLVIETNYEFIDKISDQSLSKLKKKKNDKKIPNKNNNILLNSILNSQGSSSDGHPPTKKKKKNDSLVIKPTDEFKDNYYEKNISKSKENKKDLDLVIDINYELKDKISNQGLPNSKKKKKYHNLVIETNDEFIDKISDQSLSKSKKKKNDKKRPNKSNNILLNSILNSQGSSSDGHPPTKKKKKNDSSVIKPTDEFKDNYYEKNISKSKEKKKYLDLVIDINDELKDKISNQGLPKSKKKKKDHNLVINTNDKLKDKISNQSLAESKKKKKDHSLVVGANNEFIDKIFDHSLSKTKKKKDHNLVFGTNNEFIDKNTGQSLSKSKKKKELNLVIKTYDKLIDKNYKKSLNEAKKKKKTQNSDCDLPVMSHKNLSNDSSVILHNEFTKNDNLLTEVTKKKKKKKEVKKDSILNDTQTPKITSRLSKFEEEFQHQNLNSKKKKKKKKNNDTSANN